MIQSLELTNYRNIKSIKLDFDKKETIIIWKNGQWKTSILESIFFLSIWKAFRAKSWDEAIKFWEEYSQIKAQISNETHFVWFSILPKQQIKYKISNIEKKPFNFIWNFSCVLFSPDDLQIITQSPLIRRNFLNSILIRLDRDYAYILNYYNKILKQRNAMLKEISIWKCDKAFLEIWDDKLAEYWEKIELKRISLIDKIKSKIEYYYKKISKWKDLMEIDYICTSFWEKSPSKKHFLEELNGKQKKDIIFWSTSIGPHRNDLEFTLNKKMMRHFASQWEIRSWILTLKYCEIELLKEENDDITLLLDDVFSELDQDRQKSLISLSKTFQTIITSTQSPKGYSNKKTYEIENWMIK